MAARLWRSVVVCILALAAAGAWALGHWSPVSALTAAAWGFAMALCALPALVAASFFAAATQGRRRWSAPEAGKLLRAFCAEVVDFTRLVAAMMAAVSAERIEPGPPAGAAPRPVLLIHGVLCNHAAWNTWRAALAASGFGPIRSVDLEPLLADLETLAGRIEGDLEALVRESGGQAVSIVAHSMGGLIARVLLQRMGPDRIGRIVTLATPHHGTALARAFRWRPLEQMCPESPWLTRLNAAQERGAPLPITSIYSLEDNLVAPASSAVLAGAHSVELRGIGHVGVLFSREALVRTVAALAGASS